MKLNVYYRPGSQIWLRLMAMLPTITARGRPLDKDEQRQFRLKGILPKFASLPDSLKSDSPNLQKEPVQIMSMPGIYATDAGVSSGPYALHMGGGMYARHIRPRFQVAPP